MAAWLLTSLAASAVVMSLELAAFRLYAPYFGYSVFVWGSMIATIMAAIAGGHALGGWLAGRSRSDAAVHGVILAGAIWQGAMLFCLPALLPWATEWGEGFGSAIATAAIFAAPVAALAAAIPQLISLCATRLPVGAAAGAVGALSTVGSIAGTLLTSFVLVPQLGTATTLRVACVTTAVIGAAGLVARRRILLPVAAAAAVAPLLAPGLGWERGTVWSAESAYNLVRVVRGGGQAMLLLNSGSSPHTVRNEAGPFTGLYYDAFALGPLLAPGGRALVLGMGAGTSIATLRVAAPAMRIDAVEIDPLVVRAAARWFALDLADPKLAVHTADARPWLLHDDGRYGVVQVDLYQGGPYIPFYLVTREFFALIRQHMEPGGVLMMNVFDPSPEHVLLAPVLATLRAEYPSVEAIGLTGSNTIALAFPAVHAVAEIRARLRDPALPEPLRRVAADMADRLSDPPPVAGAEVFTDDRAPVEWRTHRALAAAEATGG